MNEDNLNMEIRKFLKKVGITSQRIIENHIYEADKNGTIKAGDEIELNMTLSIKNFQSSNRIDGKITISLRGNKGFLDSDIIFLIWQLK